MAQQRNNLGGIQKASTPADFKKKREPVLLPSGQRIILRPTSLASFMQSGSIPNSLMQVVTTAMDHAKDGAEAQDEKVQESAMDLLRDPKSLTDMFEAVDKFVISVALEPRVYPVPEDEADRDDNLLYVDEIELEDRMFIFTRAIGSPGEAEPFRDKPASRVGAVQQRKAVGGTTKRAPRA